MNGFVNELIGAIVQVLLLSLVPFIWWLITARQKESFFKWIGLKNDRRILVFLNMSLVLAFSACIISFYMVY